ncbi:hypothetical protein [Iamia sp.]|uniref:hypothetical protein n=1 Tax=Iamia sp. TaxID=2722710 RepID=UPI002B789C22|nr:hypothetical protein [Iamia sp.]HXH59447.1 hypothetical protein [Iamia sp.]
MEPILGQLDREWAELATSPRGRRALTRWAQLHPVLEGLADLDALLEARRDPNRAPALLAALAGLAPDDQLAARTLLQSMVPGLIHLARSTGNDDPAALVELVSLAWERIRTYPRTRHGSVAANVLLDTRKRYRQHRLIEAPTSSLPIDTDPVDGHSSPEQVVLGRLLIEDLDRARRQGAISAPMLRVILRTRVGGERLAEVAAEHDVEPRVLCQQRWRAELRLRHLPLAS